MTPRTGRILRTAAVLSLLIALLPASGCRKRRQAQPPAAPVQAPAPAVIPASPPPPPAPGERDLADAMAALRAGDNPLAAKKLEAVIGLGWRAPGRVEALFALAVLHARPNAEARDVPRARALLEDVLAARPSAARETEARLILHLLSLEEGHASAIQSLREQMDLLKADSDHLRAALAQREEDLRKIKEILLEKSPGP